MVDITGVNTSSNQPNRITERSISRAGGSKSKNVSSSATAGDRVDISAGVKEADTVKKLVQSAQSQPEIRPELVAAVKERLERGEYEGVEVSRQTAKKILGID